ncbi:MULTISPECIES: ATP phosphoribosyltransferase [unclassified Brevibacterium]|uniref:ATP phosphoribosyltransferase n=1 Tax=unclassified Brevibacterium TaxID=2614124 RepID=UPI0008A4F4BA|nr:MULTISPECIES: ATP phosphoribosyltransferase [unclassified Brevibacterium]OFL64094.1 ATP phosphoribosyltransferase [Brevibacterium sp. HMSC063G07]OFS27167.1 ATP phosphoribosyltransferase [Brevibacterium sp. HMSC07C04]
MLRVAVPNKGSLSEKATEMLRAAGYSLRSNAKTLAHTDNVNEIEFFYLRPRDIAVYIGRGILDIGITGRDLLLESGAEAKEIMSLGFGASRFHYAGPAGAFANTRELDGKSIATSYPELVEQDLAQRGMSASIVPLDGAVEVSIQLGVADAIADVVETGTTLRAAGLETIGEPILRSEGVLIGRDGPPREAEDPEQIELRTDILLRRLESVIVARDYVLIDYDVAEENLEAAISITPGFESPTVSTLHDRGWFAVRAMVPSAEQHTLMDKLYSVGARAILVSRIDACRI